MSSYMWERDEMEVKNKREEQNKTHNNNYQGFNMLTVCQQLRIMGVMMNSALFTSLLKLCTQCCPPENSTQLRVRKLDSRVCCAYLLCCWLAVGTTKPHRGLDMSVPSVSAGVWPLGSTVSLLALSFDINVSIYLHIQWGLRTYVWLIEVIYLILIKNWLHRNPFSFTPC